MLQSARICYNYLEVFDSTTTILLYHVGFRPFYKPRRPLG